MFIKLPIKTFKLEGNKLTINESTVEYSDINEDSREILESLISKGAYYSALLHLNWSNAIKSINESIVSNEDYAKYLHECNNLMEECVVETKARNYRPLTNIGGLEIMENDNSIARGKGNILFVEDFRVVEKDESEMPGNSRADEIIFEFEQLENKNIDTYTKALNEISRMEWKNQISKNKYEECVKKLQEIYANKNKISEECEGTQCSDIAPKKDQEVGGKVQMPPKKKKFESISLDIPKNHNFNGFMMDESGKYTRGNYILVNESGTIKAVNKNLLEDYWNPCKYFEILQNMEHIDIYKWNSANQLEREDMIKPAIQDFWYKYGEEIVDNDMLETLFNDLEDNNYHTEYKLLNNIIQDSIEEKERGEE